MSYDLKNDYFAGVPISAIDLNRRADILNAQLPGAMRLAGVSPGVLPLLDSGDAEDVSLVERLGGALDALKVENGSVLPGAALVESQDETLTYVVLSESSLLPSRPENEEFLHLALRTPSAVGGPLDTRASDSRRGGAPYLLVSGAPSLPSALLLAQWKDGAWLDRRTWVAPVELARALVALQGDLALLRTRVETLESGGGGTGAGTMYLSQLLYNATDPRSAIAVLEGKIADLDAKIAALQAGHDLFPAPFDILADEIALNRAGLAEVNPHAIERGQISVVVREAGHGQSDTPDYTPDTNDPLELPYDVDSGVFGA